MTNEKLAAAVGMAAMVAEHSDYPDLANVCREAAARLREVDAVVGEMRRWAANGPSRIAIDSRVIARWADRLQPSAPQEGK